MARTALPIVMNQYPAPTRSFDAAAAWTQNALAAWTAGLASPLGGTAQGLVATAVNTDHYFYRVATPTGLVAGRRYTFGIYARARNSSWLVISNFAVNSAWFNLGAGSIGAIVGASSCEPRIAQSDLASVYLCELSFIANGTGAYSFGYFAAPSNGATTFTGDGATVEIDVDGAQLVTGPNRVGPYVDGGVNTGPLRSTP